jgi:predicted methyltransferase
MKRPLSLHGSDRLRAPGMPGLGWLPAARIRPGTCALALSAAVALIASCSTSSTRETTALALDGVLIGAQRSADERARDIYRHPKETLLFFGLRPSMTVMEVWPEPGWYTEILAPLLRERGRYIAAVIGADPQSRFVTARLDDFQHKLAARPEDYDRVSVVNFRADGTDVVPPQSVDMVVTFRNIHNWMARNEAERAFAAMYRALKPGGVLGVVEHRGAGTAPQDPRAKSGYVNEDYAIELIQAQGFRLLGESQVNANAKDTKDYEQGVWTLPPTYRLGDKDRERYAAIGESDRFTLKFGKPRK